MAADAYMKFIQLVREISLARSVQALLEWDQMTYMPKKGAGWRGEQAELLAGLAHEKLASDEMGTLLSTLEGATNGDPVAAANVREIRRQYDRAVKLPKALVQQIAKVTTAAHEEWVVARKESAFQRFASYLDQVLELKREVAERIGYEEEPYDALMDEFEPGARTAEVQAVFDALRPELVALVSAIREAPRRPDATLLSRAAPAATQATFNRSIAENMGFDFDAGRLDVSTHPFCSGFHPLDVRMTTRYDEHALGQSLFGVMHEAGHALYEQGFDPAHAGTPMASAVSLGIHESQSRLWENQVGRSRPFWQHWLPRLHEAFPAFREVGLDAWHFAVNTVRPSLIRVEADEVTYGLHIMLRFDLERRLLQNKLAVQDIPAAWNEAMQQMLGITPPNDAQGCLQDIHWSLGIFGYFPTYQLGNLYAAQFFHAARRSLADLDAQIARGELAPLRAWLKENIHRHGQRYRAAELVERVTGAPLSPQPFLEYLQAKYKPLYGLS